MASTLSAARPPNLILSSLPDQEYQILVPHFKHAVFQVGDIIYSDTSAKYVHFLNRGVVSVSLSSKGGDYLELCLIGNEGLIGVRSICLHNQFNLRCEMLTEGYGLKIPVGIFQKLFFECQSLSKLALLQLETRTLEIASIALCSQSHTVEKKFARWVLTFADRVGSDKLTATQEKISLALGVNRPSISVAAGKLQDLGLLRCRRGDITILDRAGLEGVVCDCYFATKEIINNYRAQTLELKKYLSL